MGRDKRSRKMKFLFAKEVEITKGGYTRCEVVSTERELGDYASEDMFNKIKDFLTEETDEKRHVFMDTGERVCVEVFYDADKDVIMDAKLETVYKGCHERPGLVGAVVSEYGTVKCQAGLHKETGIILHRQYEDGDDVPYFPYVLPHDGEKFLEEIIFPIRELFFDLDDFTELDIHGIEAQGADAKFYTHGENGEIIELDSAADFVHKVSDWEERTMSTAKQAEYRRFVIFLDEEA